MIPEEIHIDDWMRMLIGAVPLSFLLELAIRAVFVYLILIVSMRLMGKRMSSQLSRTELAALVSLAAAIGIPLMSPNRGVLPAFVIALVLILIERYIAARATKSQKFESYVQGEISTLVKDGVIDIAVLESIRLSRERLMAQIRSNGITQMGMIKRLYMEANGSFTIIKSKTQMPGLPTLPAWDEELDPYFDYAQDIAVCKHCALTQKQPLNDNSPCPNCSKKVWTIAVKAVNL